MPSGNIQNKNISASISIVLLKEHVKLWIVIPRRLALWASGRCCAGQAGLVALSLLIPRDRGIYRTKSRRKPGDKPIPSPLSLDYQYTVLDSHAYESMELGKTLVMT